MSKKSNLPDLLKLQEFPQPEIRNLRYPVLLCHGFGALASLFNPSPLHETAMILRSHGIKAFAPNIVPYATIEIRAAGWGKIVAKLLESIPERKIHIVAHSMAGLDMRYALHRLQFHDHVASLITFSSPHHGSPLADLILETPEVLRKPLIKLTDYFGSKTYPSINSDARGALHQLTPDYVKNVFNEQCPPDSKVPFYSITSSCGIGTEREIGAVLNTFNKHIYEREGENDAFVSRKSAAWGEVLFNADLSHYEQVRLLLSKKDESRWESVWKRIYTIQRQIEQEG